MKPNVEVVVVPLEDLRKMIETAIDNRLAGPQKEEFISPADACRQFRISGKTLKKYRENGFVTSRRVGDRILVSRKEIETMCITRNPETR